jgi:phosphoglycolate phosphatase-like HAD superfamily hydrolase
MREHKLNPDDVIFVGDRETDMQAARAAHVRGVLIPPEVGLEAALDQLL